jgi:hypothetical protein
MIFHFLASILFGYSLAVLLVEKGENWPISIIVNPLKFVLSFINQKISKVFDCTVCMSFWACLIGEISLYLFITGMFYWPFTGILCLGFTWTVIEFMNILDK